MTTVLTGENSFLLRAELNRLIGLFEAEYTDMGLEQLDGEEASYDKIREALESLPFLASKKLVVLTQPSSNKEFLEKSAELLASVPETTDVILVEPKLDKRLSYYKFLKKNAQMNEFKEPDQRGLVEWATSWAELGGGSLSANDARYLVERVGQNQQLLSHEITKLITYNPQINRQAIDLLTDKTPQSTIFELLDAALNGQSQKALELYDQQRFLKVEPQQILALLAWQLHVLAIVKTAASRSSSEIAKQAKINPYVVSKSQNLAKKLSLMQIKRLISQSLELDIKLKSQPIDADQALTNLLVSIGK